MKNKLLLLSVIALQGCAATVADVGVMAVTGKSTASHVISEVHKQDCNTLRVLEANEVCRKVYYGQSYHVKSPKDLLAGY